MNEEIFRVGETDVFGWIVPLIEPKRLDMESLTNIQILEACLINHKSLKKEKPMLLFNILRAMDRARSEHNPIKTTESKIDLEKIEKNVDDVLAKETPESLQKWLLENRLKKAIQYGR